jgi:DNA-binding transcriptional LysR family regulator
MPAPTLRNVDLNLLVAFSALMRERSVTGAARRLFIGQSGMSGALARLRVLFDDPLLVQVGRRLEPTPRALRLAEEVDRALAIIESSLEADGPFQLRRSTRTFTLGLTDDCELLFAPELARALRAEAPDARLVVRPVDVHSLRGALDEEGLDAAVSVASELPSWHESSPLFSLEYRCVWSPRQVGAIPRLTPRKLVELPHALVTFRGDLTSVLDEALAAQGLRRQVVLGLPRFAALAEVLTTQPLLATVPAHFAAYLVKRHELASAPLPLALPERQVRLVYRRRDAALPELGWFRELVARVITGGDGPSRRSAPGA